MNVRVGPYAAPMAAQVAELFHRQYGTDRRAWLERFALFYEHPYQRERCIRLVALKGETVLGFAGFVRWPYTLGARRFESMQCCDVLLDPRARGQGVMQRMLDIAGEQRGIDFLVGFPVASAKKAFLRNGWQNVLNLQWHIHVILSRADGEGSQNATSVHSEILRSAQDDEGLVRLTHDADFLAWRQTFSKDPLQIANFECKPIRRLRILRELIVGDIRTNAPDFTTLAKAARKAKATYLSIAINPLDPLVQHLRAAGFRRVNRTIAFVVKPLAEAPTNPAQWRLFRSDIDTW